ncbi:MAG: alanyl-tRNA editing protein AlaXM [Nanoarchaeota archaeon]
MEQALYLNNSYQKEFEASVLKAGENQVILDKTLFYPTGGGQLHDTGKLMYNNSEYVVLSVRKSELDIFHELDKEGLKPGDKVKGVIDWNRRYKLMRSHTAMHLVSAIAIQDTGALITGNQIDIDKSRIDFDLEEFNKELLQSFIEKANKIIKEDRKVKSYYLPREEALKVPEIFRLAKAFPDHIKDIRIVEIEGIDRQADGGTHVKSLKEIGEIELLSFENKGKNRRRIYFRLKE